MSVSFKVITTPTTEPVTVQELAAWLRIDWSDDTALLTTLISRARSFAETVTHRALATQTIQVVNTIEQPVGGTLSGSLTPGPDWYQFQEQLGANPFGPAQFYFDLPAPPLQSLTTIETMVTAFDGAWLAFTGTTFLDNNREPARLYLRDPITANFYRFTYQAGYSDSYPIPPDLKQCLLDLCAWWYENRSGIDPPASIMNRLLAKRVDWV